MIVVLIIYSIGVIVTYAILKIVDYKSVNSWFQVKKRIVLSLYWGLTLIIWVIIKFNGGINKLRKKYEVFFKTPPKWL